MYTFTIVTRDAAPAIQTIHDRMPVILQTDEGCDVWINCKNHGAEEAMKMIQKLSTVKKEELKEDKEELVFYQVAALVNSWKHNVPDCIKPYVPPKVKGIESYFTKLKKEEKVDVKIKKEEVTEIVFK